MRTKSLQEPSKKEAGDEWLSPDGYSPSYHRIWDGQSWNDDGESFEEIEEDTDEDEQPPTDEDQSDEQGVQAEISDSDGGKQGPSGRSGSEPQQRGKRGQIRKGGTSKRK